MNSIAATLDLGSTPTSAAAENVWLSDSMGFAGRAAREIEFMKAMQEYKKSSGRMFPTWSEALEVIVGLGYRKPA